MDLDLGRMSAGRLPDHEIWRLVAAVAGVSVTQAKLGVKLNQAERVRLSELVNRRLAGYPLQYLEGKVGFGPVVVAVDERVLIPRPETEYLYTLVADLDPPPRLVVDLCTGSGALALALKYTYPSARVVGVDISPKALSAAVANGKALGLGVEWRLGNLWSALPAPLAEEIDLLVANPPYVSEAEWATLPADVKCEPKVALVAGPAGTEVIEEILAGLTRWLRPGGRALIEVGETQAEQLGAQFSLEVVSDQYGKPRYLRA